MDKKSKYITFIRHAESKENSGEWEIGLDNSIVPLSEAGFLQAKKVWKNESWSLGSYDKVFVSPYLRTQETFEIITQDVTPHYDSRLREIYFSNIGMEHGELLHIFKWLKTEASEHEYLFYEEKGLESMVSLYERVESFMNDFKNEEGSEFLIVGHSIWFKAFEAYCACVNRQKNPYKFMYENRNKPCLSNCEKRYMSFTF